MMSPGKFKKTVDAIGICAIIIYVCAAEMRSYIIITHSVEYSRD